MAYRKSRWRIELSNDNIKPLYEKRIETFQILLEATKKGRVEWEKLGEDGFVAQPSKLAVSAVREYLPEVGAVFYVNVTNNAGSPVDQFSINHEDMDLFDCMKELFVAARQDIDRRVGQNLDELVESLRA